MLESSGQQSPSSLTQRVMDPPADSHPLVAPWIWALEDARRRTLYSLDGITQDALDWVPPEGGNSIGTLLYHVVVIEMSYIYEDILGVDWAEELVPILPCDVRDDQGHLVPVTGESLAIHRERLEQSRVLTLRVLQDMDDQDFRRPRPTGNDLVSPEWIVHHLMQHEAEHRGQIGHLRERAEGAHNPVEAA